MVFHPLDRDTFPRVLNFVRKNFSDLLLLTLIAVGMLVCCGWCGRRHWHQCCRCRCGRLTKLLARMCGRGEPRTALGGLPLRQAPRRAPIFTGARTQPTVDYMPDSQVIDVGNGILMTWQSVQDRLSPSQIQVIRNLLDSSPRNADGTRHLNFRQITPDILRALRP